VHGVGEKWTFSSSSRFSMNCWHKIEKYHADPDFANQSKSFKSISKNYIVNVKINFQKIQALSQPLGIKAISVNK
jgi:hypothetical protein